MSLRPKAVEFDETWAHIKNGLEDVFLLRDIASVIWMDMYQYTYNLCTAHPTPLADKTYEALEEFLKEHVKKIQEKVSVFEGADLLKEYLKEWTTFDMGSLICSAVLRYLNDNWIKRRTEDARGSLAGVYTGTDQPSVYEIRELALVIWRDTFFSSVKDRLQNQLLRLITTDRNNEMIDKPLVAGIVKSFVVLGLSKNKPLEVYRDDFEAPYVTHMVDYYERESVSFLAQNSCSDYMKKAEARLDEEVARCDTFLHESSADVVAMEMVAVLVAKHIDMLQSECEPMIREERLSDLRRMHGLLKRVPDGFAPMLQVLQLYVTETGLAAIKNMGKDAQKDPAGYVGAVLATFVKYKTLVKDAFGNDAPFSSALDKAMRVIVNDETLFGSCKSSELLAKYCDLLLKKSKHNLEESALDERLNRIIEIFQYIDDKDVFQKFYSRMLAKRLINKVSVSDDAESGMLSRLKQACGYDYVAKLQRMFQDLAVNEQLNSGFTAKSGDTLEVDFSIQVLTAGSWPLEAKVTSFALPTELAKAVRAFELFYHNQHQGRKLSWLHHLSKGEVKSHYLKKDKEFQCTLYQMAVLLLFNRHEKIKVEDVRSITQLSKNECVRTVRSLVANKLLKCEGKDGKNQKDFVDVDELFLNEKYTNKRHKVKISSSLDKATKPEDDATMKAVQEDRNYFLQAVIVRVLKARKRMPHKPLLDEVMEQSRVKFKPATTQIKKQIEFLIDKGYMERAEGEKGVYLYVA